MGQAIVNRIGTLGMNSGGSGSLSWMCVCEALLVRGPRPLVCPWGPAVCEWKQTSTHAYLSLQNMYTDKRAPAFYLEAAKFEHLVGQHVLNSNVLRDRLGI